MNNALRILLRLVTLVLGISVVIVGIGGGAYYMWRDAQGNAPKVGFHIATDKLEQEGWKLYLTFLKSQGKDYTVPRDANDATPRTFIVDSGDSAGQVGVKLEEQGLVTDGELFRRVVQYMGASQDIQAGVYALRPNMTMEELVLQLQHGRLLPVNVTVPEGWRAEQIAQWLETQGVVVSADEFMAAVRQGRSDLQFLLDRPAGSSASLEGYLFPAKYQFDQRSDPHDVIGQMLAAWSSAWSDQIPEELRQKAAEQHRTIYEVLTLAALVEREAVASEERPVIAGVYMNRIAQGMYLQADPTVQYAKGFDPVTGRWWAPMEQEEAITVVSPYNTFLNPGLPPGPICNPGVASIRAALEPDVSGGYLFFYAMHDEGGHHAFARTYEEHLANEQLYGGGGGASQ